MNTTIHISQNEIIIHGTAKQVAHRQHLMYHVVFDNGYENVFFTDVESGNWIEEDMGFTKLASILGYQFRLLHCNPFHVNKILTWHRQVYNDKLIAFGFFNYMKGHHKMYEIYDSKRKYLYTLVEMDKDDWQIMGNSNLLNGKIDPFFVDQVTRILPLYMADM